MNAVSLPKQDVRRFLLVFDVGDEVVAGLTQFAEENHVQACQIQAIGGFSDLVLGYYDWEKKEYQPIPIRSQVEVVSLLGNITWLEGRYQLHAHAMVAMRDGTARGGHLLEAHVRPTLEVEICEVPAQIWRKRDQETHLALIHAIAYPSAERKAG